jgi:hypothetical protein
MIDPELKDLWTPVGLILGFQVSLFKWRLERESQVGDAGDIPWLVPSDYVSILGMLVLVFGSILLPLSGFLSARYARVSFGLGSLFFVGQAMGLAGHYQLYNKSKRREFVWFPFQERVVILLTVVGAGTYFFLGLR